MEEERPPFPVGTADEDEEVDDSLVGRPGDEGQWSERLEVFVEELGFRGAIEGGVHAGEEEAEELPEVRPEDGLPRGVLLPSPLRFRERPRAGAARGAGTVRGCWRWCWVFPGHREEERRGERERAQVINGRNVSGEFS
jgi:hypothetical protein